MVGAKVALRRGMSQLRRLAPLAKQAIKEAGQHATDVLRRGYRRILDRINPKVSFYHGTSPGFAAQIRANGIDLAKSRYGTDFGRGFYTAPTFEGATNSARRLYGEAVEVVEFRIPRRQLERLSELAFGGPTPDWQDFVRLHRGEFELGGAPGAPPQLLEHGGELYDLVTGPLFRRRRRSGAILHYEGLSQTSVHTQRAIDLFNRYIIR